MDKIQFCEVFLMKDEIVLLKEIGHVDALKTDNPSLLELHKNNFILAKEKSSGTEFCITLKGERYLEYLDEKSSKVFWAGFLSWSTLIIALAAFAKSFFF